MTELWFRNPHNYIRELVETRECNVTWDKGLLIKRKLDPYVHAKTYFAGNNDWRVLVIATQGTPEFRLGYTKNNPYAVYPTWSYEHDNSLALLEEMMQYPIGEDESAYNDKSVKPEERPVKGQEHRVIITDLPSMSTYMGKNLIVKIKELQEKYPECIVHIHGIYGWRVNFGLGFRSVDIDPRTDASKGNVTLPNGSKMQAERTVSHPQWVRLIGMSTVDLIKEPRNRCIFNIKSARWASENFMENVLFKAQGSTSSLDVISKKVKPVTTNFPRVNNNTKLSPKEGDKILCNSCSLSQSCKYYRDGAVCSVPGTEATQLSDMFRTRDSDVIIDGLGTLMAMQSHRLVKGVKLEEEFGGIDPEVTKIINQMFTNGEKLAKLVDPALRNPNVQVNVSGNAAAIQASTPNQFMATVVKELERRGYRREDITPQMVGELLAEMTGKQKPEAIEGTVIRQEA